MSTNELWFQSGETPVWEDDFNTLSGWTTAGAGSFTTTGSYLVPSSYGSGGGWHGPELRQNFTPSLSDFEVRLTSLDIQNISSDLHQWYLFGIGTGGSSDYVFGFYFIDAHVSTSGASNNMYCYMSNGWNAVTTNQGSLTFNGDISISRSGSSMTFDIDGYTPLTGTNASGNNLTGFWIRAVQYSSYSVPTQRLDKLAVFEG